jgi:hypothetical protein
MHGSHAVQSSATVLPYGHHVLMSGSHFFHAPHCCNVSYKLSILPVKVMTLTAQLLLMVSLLLQQQLAAVLSFVVNCR